MLFTAVSRSTLKRACRGHNITRWPSNEKNKGNPSLFLTRAANKSSPGPKRQFSMSNSDPPSDSGFVIVEADFEGDTMKFKFPFSSGMEKLEEEVARRLKLNVTSFRMKYLDGEGKWILLACDDDLQLCMETLAWSGTVQSRCWFNQCSSWFITCIRVLAVLRLSHVFL
ncbi:UNVERIFIED_CONTAM: protein NLP7 [Sesamum angustifolium]|uniref:Protein NLP7 n=1 Tax=Sesamum angustifolium TaxID=2727405 RepID=A0AAW2P2H4_9LAMI